MNTKLPTLEVNTKTGDEPFHVGGKALPLTLLNYWRWSGSDLVSNAQRGILAEYLVGSALKMTESVRLEWDAFDIRTPSGLKGEVKTSAYIHGRRRITRPSALTSHQKQVGMQEKTPSTTTVSVLQMCTCSAYTSRFLQPTRTSLTQILGRFG